jgi:tetratricopeptide (TPR) repeat protein
MTALRVEMLTVPGCRIGAENPLPVFRSRQTDRAVQLHLSVPEEKRPHFGWQAGARLLPYRLQDQYTRRREDYSMNVIVLENEVLKATFWIELGGRLMSLVYKPLERELLFSNPVFQPANLALRDAWFAGGIEWNVGHYGHSFLTCSPVFAAQIRGAQGEPGLRLYEYERCKGFLWHTDFYLPPASEFLAAYTRVINPHRQDSSIYWWTNIAVPEAEGVRVLAAADDALYLDRDLPGFGYARLPHLPSLPGKDPTYALHWPSANEFFFQCDGADIPWEAALDAQGKGFIEASSPRLRYRKLFCWGTHQGGRHWQEFLAEPGMNYLEIQAGLAPTQLHHLPFAAGAACDWTELFGYIEVAPARAHDPDYHAAWRAVDASLKQRVTAQGIQQIESACRANADQPPAMLLQAGSGWGALEAARRRWEGAGGDIPRAFDFPPESMSREQQRWLRVLEGGALPEQPPDQVPGEWLVQAEWKDLLAASLANPANKNWYALLHYGVMLAEAFDDAGAEAAWRESLALAPSAWAWRNLAALYESTGKTSQASEAYAHAWQLAREHCLPLEPLAHEYLRFFISTAEFTRAWQFLASLPDEVKQSERILILQAAAALELGRVDVVERVLAREFASVREGQVDLSNLWLELWRRRMAQETGQSSEQIPLSQVSAVHAVPRRIDFRSAEEEQ